MTLCADTYQDVLFNAFRSLRLDSIIFYKDSVLTVQDNALDDAKKAIELGKEIEESLNNENAYLRKEQKTLIRKNRILSIVCGALGLTTLMLLI